MSKFIICFIQPKRWSKEMIEKISDFLTEQIRQEQPEIDNERAEAINYGIQLMFGEVPKIFLLFFLSFLLGVGPLTIATFIILLLYKAFSGGFHAKTHFGCIVSTNVFYIGCALLAKYLVIPEPIRLGVIAVTWIVGIILVTKYAPADTENFPILRKKERKQRKILSYITLTIVLLIATFVPWRELGIALILTTFIQSLFLTPVVYKITKNKYGYEVYGKEECPENL